MRKWPGDKMVKGDHGHWWTRWSLVSYMSNLLVWWRQYLGARFWVGSVAVPNEPVTRWWWSGATTGSASGQQMVSWAPSSPQPPCLQQTCCPVKSKHYKYETHVDHQSILDQDGVGLAFCWERTCYKTRRPAIDKLGGDRKQGAKPVKIIRPIPLSCFMANLYHHCILIWQAETFSHVYELKTPPPSPH